jgi:hypothetical protein
LDVEDQGRVVLFRHGLRILLLWVCLACAAASAEPVWVVAPGDPGPDIPPQGRSLFDHLTADNGRQLVPFPYESLLALLREKLSPDAPYLGQTLKQVLIPLGRSLQREAAAPHFFASPRVVLAVDAAPATTPTDTGILLRDRLFIAYLEAANVLEVISYNEASARFEFQVVHDYGPGGEPQVMYARRLVCMACHQNAAPIFARPLWDETNANPLVSRQLQKTGGTDYHGIPHKLGVDTAYAIDNSTDRANGFTLTQKLWQQGCGSGDAGSRCRAALLARTLQYAFTGGRGFDDRSVDYEESLRQPMLESRRRIWPQGLWIPDPDISNRRPLAGLVPETASAQDRLNKALAERSNITAAFEPLAPRSPQSNWNPGPDAWVARAVSGLAQFLTPDDVRRIDAHLAKTPASESSATAKCSATPARQTNTERIKIECHDDKLSFNGLLYSDLSGGRIKGRLRNLRSNGEEFGSVTITGIRDADGQWLMKLHRTDSRLRVRRANGDELVRLELRRQPQDTTRVAAELTVRHDGHLLGESLRRLAASKSESLTSGPFRRADILPDLFKSLGLEPLSWCCTRSPIALPPPKVEPPAPPLDQPRLAAFIKACAGCHRSNAPFPPNFLAGAADEVLRRIAHCGERIQYRLAMWDINPEKRAKTPMPPLHSVSVQQHGGRHWMSGLLPELRKALREITASEADPLPAEQETIARPYVELRPCLPVS